MRGHVEQQEVLLLGGEDALLSEVLSQTLPHILQLIAQLQRVPRLTTQILNPCLKKNAQIRSRFRRGKIVFSYSRLTHLNAFRVFRLFHVFQRLVEKHIATGVRVLDRQLPR